MRRLAVVGVLLSLGVARVAFADGVVEVWRSPFGAVRSVSANDADGSCWAAAGGSVMHIAADGAILGQFNGFTAPVAVAANSADGSCWVLDGSDGEWSALIHLSKDGTELLRLPGVVSYDYGLGGTPIAVSPADGSVWAKASAGGEVVHLAQDGSELVRVAALGRVTGLAVNPTDGSCWIAAGWEEVIYITSAEAADGQRSPGAVYIWHGWVTHLADNGTELSRTEDLGWCASLSVNPVDGSCWAEDSGRLVHLGADGAVLWEGGSDLYPVRAVSVSRADGSCWVAGDYAVWHLSADGTVLWREEEDTARPTSVSVNSRDGSCWFGHLHERQVLHVAPDGGELWSGTGFAYPVSLSVAPGDGSCWVADSELDKVTWLSESGEVLWEGERPWVSQVVADPAGGSSWVVTNDTAYHVPAAGTDPWADHLEGLNYVKGFSLDAADRSCWVSNHLPQPEPEDPFLSEAVRFAADGAELARWGPVEGHITVSASPSNGGCWVGFPDTGQVIGLNGQGVELFRLDGCATLPGPCSKLGGPSVDPVDGTCWVTQLRLEEGVNSLLLHLTSDGTQLLRLESADRLGDPEVIAADASCWLRESHRLATGTSYDHDVVHLAADGTEIGRASVSRDDHSWLLPELWSNPADGSCWVRGPQHQTVDGRWWGELIYLAADGSEIWRPTGPEYAFDIAVSPADGSAWLADRNNGQVVHLAVFGSLVAFPDVLYYRHWAYPEIQGCVDAGIVCGYPDGLYHPEFSVTRDQMAVYIARALVSPAGDAGIPEPGPTPTFPDVLPNFWAYKHIEYIYSQHIAEGYRLGKYEPGVAVDRGQMAVFIARAMVAPGGDAAIPGPPPTATFPDVPSDSWAYKHVEHLASQGVVHGYEDGLYHPEIVVTRDQMAVYIARAFELM